MPGLAMSAGIVSVGAGFLASFDAATAAVLVPAACTGSDRAITTVSRLPDSTPSATVARKVVLGLATAVTGTGTGGALSASRGRVSRTPALLSRMPRLPSSAATSGWVGMVSEVLGAAAAARRDGGWSATTTIGIAVAAVAPSALVIIARPDAHSGAGIVVQVTT